jgi:hypothetical protein
LSATTAKLFRMANYQDAARQAARRYGLDESVFLRQIRQESGFNPNAVSPAGAIGIAQIMPATARGWGVNPHDPHASLNAAAKNMASYVKKYGSYRNALIAYNAGPGAVGRGSLPAETQNYIKTILGGRTPGTGSVRSGSGGGGGGGSTSSDGQHDHDDDGAAGLRGAAVGAAVDRSSHAVAAAGSAVREHSGPGLRGACGDAGGVRDGERRVGSGAAPGHRCVGCGGEDARRVGARRGTAGHSEPAAGRLRRCGLGGAFGRERADERLSARQDREDHRDPFHGDPHARGTGSPIGRSTSRRRSGRRWSRWRAVPS